MSKRGSESSMETETVSIGLPSSTSTLRRGAPPIGSNVGRYVVLEVIGRGAMGRVLRAYDPKLQREVAIKVVLDKVRDVDTRSRMLREARAMAQLSHPNVVAVYDAEESEEGVILVMEYVKGQTLKQWVGSSTHSWQEIVARYVEAGKGLAAAHAEELLHRDFKPANVLVADSGEVKVTDFGLAKLASATGRVSLDASSRLLSSGFLDGTLTHASTVVGTPRYMAPEQQRGEALKPAVDQYGFCVALWEALSGKPPFPTMGFAALLALKEESKGPQWPAAANTVPRALVEVLRRGLSADPDDRWPNMDALLTELASDPGRRKRRWLIVLLGGLAVVVASTMARRSRLERCTGAEQQLTNLWDEARRNEIGAAMLGLGVSYAEPVWERTRAELDLYAAAWTGMYTEVCDATTVRGEQSSAVMDLRMACLQRAKVGLRSVTQVLTNADDDVVNNAHELVGGLPPLSRCADVEALASDVEPPLPQEAETVEAIQELLSEAQAERNAARYVAAQSKVQEAKARLSEVGYGPIHTAVAHQEGTVLDELGYYDASEAALREALRLASRSRQWDELQWISQDLMRVVGLQQQHSAEGLRYYDVAKELAAMKPRRAANLKGTFAKILQQQGKFEQAEEEARQALVLYQRSTGAADPQLAHLRTHLANILMERGRYEEAEAEQRRALATLERFLGPEHPATADSHGGLATILDERGKHKEAVEEERRALSIVEDSLGPEHPTVASLRHDMADFLWGQGRYEEAEVEVRKSLAIRDKNLRPDNPILAESWHLLALILSGKGEYAAAEQYYRQALTLWSETLGPGHSKAAVTRNNLATALLAQGKHEEAELESRSALMLLKKVHGPEHPHVAAALNSLGMVLEAQDRNDEAEVEYRRSMVLFEKLLKPDHPLLAVARSDLASILMRRGEIPEALRLAELAWPRRQRDDLPAEQAAKAAFVLAQALWESSTEPSERARARTLAKHALASYQQAGSAHADQAERAEMWLADHRSAATPG